MGVLTAVLNTLIILISLFLICLILIQRGKGGGLAGAFGGVGGSSAFGTKAGDTFTKITIVTAAIWILMAMVLVVLTNRPTASSWGTDAPSSPSKSLTPGTSRKPGSTGEPASGGASKPSSATPTPEAAPSGAVPALPKDASFPTEPGAAPKKP